jgi:hypothetical protein
MSEEICLVCSGGGDKPVLKAVERRSAKTAHELAMKEAIKKASKDFSFVELYTIYFKRIYDHEYSRNLYYMRNKHEYQLYKEALKTWALCDYHGEFDLGFNETCMKDLDKKYSRNKWPNPVHW